MPGRDAGIRGKDNDDGKVGRGSTMPGDRSPDKNALPQTLLTPLWDNHDIRRSFVMRQQRADTLQYTCMIDVGLTGAGAQDLRLANRPRRLKRLGGGQGDCGKDNDDGRDSGGGGAAHGNGSPDKNALSP